jgi:hypothetical protein
MNIYFLIQCIAVGLLGTILSTLSVIYNLAKKAKLANIQFAPSDYFKSDWYAPVISIVSIILAAFFLPYVPKNAPLYVVIILFATIGYTGNDLVSRFFSTVNNRINAAIDYKTTISDTQTGTLDKPTPAAPPPKTP